ncbi:phosphotransferase [Stappia sp. GBMRC 2046]|uniref:Phosphotransferase n=1 Tax=Stappia sediminis TaxID=2692190 RepID=A0A7X3S8S6_9HYPH|nr:phosphotransferase family protein [Stappia sediminis]MXN66133.1 phosphotransferase [Stappia sediminis]
MSGRIDRQEAFSGTKEVPAALSFDRERLQSYLESEIADFEGPVEVRQFKGGQSNPTYLVATPGRDYVLRRKPPGKLLPSAHAIDREYRVMSALGAAGFPVPKTFLLCEAEGVIGTAFYVMEKVNGRIVWEPSVPGVDTTERSAIYRAMNETLARLHRYEPDAIGLGDFGKPEGYVARQVARWSKQYRASETEKIDEMDKLIDWLPKNLPPENPARVVHGDFRLDNLILATGQPRVLAVLDWELSTLGDPVADFTYHCMQWEMPAMPDGSGIGSLEGLNLAALGIPSLDTYIGWYEAATGFAVRDRLDFYFAYNFFRIAAILQGIAGRVRDGTAANENAAAMIRQIGPLARTAWRFARQAGAGG